MGAKEKKDNSQRPKITVEDLYTFCTRFEPDISFWEENSELKNYEPYKTLYKEEKKKPKGSDFPLSSLIMDAIWALYDTKSKGNKIAAASAEEMEIVKNQVLSTIFGDENFDLNKYQHIIKAYKKHSKTRLERDIDMYDTKLTEVGLYMENLSAVDSAEDIMDSLKKFNDITEIRDKMKERLVRDRAKQSFRKGTRLHRVERIGTEAN